MNEEQIRAIAYKAADLQFGELFSNLEKIKPQVSSEGSTTIQTFASIISNIFKATVAVALKNALVEAENSIRQDERERIRGTIR